MYILSQQDIERLGTQVLGLDPIIFVGVVTIACGAVGWLIGPFAGGAVFAMRWRGWRGEMAAVSTILPALFWGEGFHGS